LDPAKKKEISQRWTAMNSDEKARLHLCRTTSVLWRTFKSQMIQKSAVMQTSSG